MRLYTTITEGLASIHSLLTLQVKKVIFSPQLRFKPLNPRPLALHANVRPTELSCLDWLEAKLILC